MIDYWKWESIIIINSFFDWLIDYSRLSVNHYRPFKLITESWSRGLDNDTRGIIRQYNGACDSVNFYFYSNDDPTWNYFVEEKSPRDPYFPGLADIYSFYPNGLLISITCIQFMLFCCKKSLRPLVASLCTVLTWDTDYRQQVWIDSRNTPVTTGLSVFRK